MSVKPQEARNRRDPWKRATRLRMCGIDPGTSLSVYSKSNLIMTMALSQLAPRFGQGWDPTSTKIGDQPNQL